MLSHEEQQIELRALEQEIKHSNCSQIILSSECFHLYNNKLFLSFVKNYRVSIICYLRHPLEYVESLYGQNIVDDTYLEGRTLKEFIESGIPTTQYFHFLQRWEAVAAKDDFIIRMYGKGFLEGGNSITDFIHALSLSDECADNYNSERQNQSYSKVVLEFKRRLNKLSKRKFDGLNHYLASYERELNSSKYQGTFFSKELIDAFMLNFSEENLGIGRYFKFNDEFLFKNISMNSEFAGISEVEVRKILLYLESNCPNVYQMIKAVLLKDKEEQTSSDCAVEHLIEVLLS